MRRSKKGITPIIAIILIMMMTVAAAGAAFFWILRVQSSFQGSSEQHFEVLNENINSQIGVVLAEFTPHNTSNSGNLTLVLRNTGGTPILLSNTSTSPTTTMILQDRDQKIICNEDWNGANMNCINGCGSNLAVSGQGTVVLNLSANCNIANDTTYANGSVFFFKVDFYGKAGTGSSFVK